MRAADWITVSAVLVFSGLLASVIILLPQPRGKEPPVTMPPRTPGKYGSGFAFPSGPRGGTQCCGKPEGCDGTHDGCDFLWHRWKLDNIPGHRERMEQRRADQGNRMKGNDS